MPDLDKIYEHILDQYSDGPNWQKYYKVFGELTDELRAVILQWMAGRYLETAEGYWLDICGEILGYPRPELWDQSGVFTWDSTVYDERWDQGVWTTPNGAGLGTGTLASDTTYLALLRAKAYASNSNGSIYDIAIVLDLAFGLDVTVETVSARTVHVTFNDPATLWHRHHARNLIPIQADSELLIVG